MNTWMYAMIENYRFFVGWHNIKKLTRAWLGGGGGYLEPPLIFQIVAKLINGSSRNFQFLQIHQLYTLCPKRTFATVKVRPEMTSEWRHIWPIWCKIRFYGNHCIEQSFWARSTFDKGNDTEYLGLSYGYLKFLKFWKFQKFPKKLCNFSLHYIRITSNHNNIMIFVCQF